MKPVQNMRDLGTHLERERPQRVMAIGEQGNVLGQLQAWRVPPFIQASVRLRLQRWHKTKAFAGGGLGVVILAKAPRTLAHHDLTVVLLGTPMADVPPVQTHLERPVRSRPAVPRSGPACDKAWLCVPPLGF